jgi:CDP-glycerol glycerophosphotransferase (TagB/SpsB family)
MASTAQDSIFDSIFQDRDPYKRCRPEVQTNLVLKHHAWVPEEDSFAVTSVTDVTVSSYSGPNLGSVIQCDLINTKVTCILHSE